MISASDVPACSACGCREVHPVIRVPTDLEADVIVTHETLYACRQCGRDVTDIWKAIQPAPPPVSLLGSKT